MKHALRSIITALTFTFMVTVSLTGAAFASTSQHNNKPSKQHWRSHIVHFPTRQQWKMSQHRSMAAGAPAGSGDLAYYNGSVQKNPVSYVIFWGAAWDGGAGTLTPDAQVVMNYLNNVGGTPFENILTQYYDTVGSIVNTHTVGGVWLDTSAPPTDTSCGGATVQDSDIQNEVSNAIAANSWPTDGANAVYYVYTPTGILVNDGTGACSESTFCAYHNFSSSVGVAYGAMAYPDQLNGCGVPLSPNGNAYGDSLASLTSHEQFEAITDPSPGSGWVDAAGYEIGDKCAWNFPPSYTVLGTYSFEVQYEYSNATSSCVNSY